MLALDQAGAGLDVARRAVVPRGLASWVEGAWVQGPRPGPAPDWLVVPDPSSHLVVSRRPDGRVRASLVGARSRSVSVSGDRVLTVAVRFRPGVLPRLTGDEARALTDRSMPVAELSAEGADRALEAADRNDGAAVLEGLWALLAERLADAGPVDWRVRALDAHAGATPGRVARAHGVSPRGLRAVAAAELGLSPARHLRVRRLQRALALRLGGRCRTWEEAAAVAGYHDPSHLVREARALLGETPGAYERRRGPPGSGRADPYNHPRARPV